MSEIYLDGLLDELVPADPRDGWNDVVHRARRSQRRYVVLVTMAAVLVLAPATWAAVKAFEGTPAPPSVKKAFRFSNQARFTGQFARDLPQAEASKAHGVLQVRTKNGPFDIWAAPSTTGGICFLNAFERDRKFGIQFGAEEGCITSGDPRLAASILSDTSATGAEINILWGYAQGAETRVRVTWTNGRRRTLPVVEHFFLAALPQASSIQSIVGLDAAGHSIARCVGTGNGACMPDGSKPH